MKIISIIDIFVNHKIKTYFVKLNLVFFPPNFK